MDQAPPRPTWPSEPTLSLIRPCAPPNRADWGLTAAWILSFSDRRRDDAGGPPRLARARSRQIAALLFLASALLYSQVNSDSLNCPESESFPRAPLISLPSAAVVPHSGARLYAEWGL